MLSRAVNVFRKKKPKKSSSFPDGDEDTNASGTETEPDDNSCHSEPVGWSATASNLKPRRDQSPASSSTECFQDVPEERPPHLRRSGEARKVGSWTALKKRASKAVPAGDDGPADEGSCSSASSGVFGGSRSLLSTIRRARSRSRSSAVATNAGDQLASFPSSRTSSVFNRTEDRAISAPLIKKVMVVEEKEAVLGKQSAAKTNGGGSIDRRHWKESEIRT
uniref:Uncharacterized protein n=1 Tax=Anopheles atroparvus TaxID=41427 RepID=A0A182JLC8_ANOAO